METRSALRDIDLCERRLQPVGEHSGIVIGPEVHEIEVRLVVEHVIVNGRNLDAASVRNIDKDLSAGLVDLETLGMLLQWNFGGLAAARSTR